MFILFLVEGFANYTFIEMHAIINVEKVVPK